MIELRLNEDGESSFTLCGTDISKLVRGASFELELDSGRPKLRAELDLLLFKDVRFGGDAIVGLSDDMVELLESFGWTPPAE